MHEYLSWTHDAWAWWNAEGVPWALVAGAVLVVLFYYISGPGWLPHHSCPHCCWCSGGPPLGDRIEARVAERVREVAGR